MDAREELIETLSEQIHKVYCDYYHQRHGKPYWTNGMYHLLDEETKEADRFMARFIIEDRKRVVSPLVKIEEMENNCEYVNEQKLWNALVETLKNAGVL